MMLQTMFSSPILQIEELHPGYENHASNAENHIDIYIVYCLSKEV